VKLTEEFLKHIKNWGLTADNEPISLFFQHHDDTIITISLKEILENQDKVEKYEQEIQQLEQMLAVWRG
jgi:hypothetical protein